MVDFDPTKSQNPWTEPILMKLGMVDYVRDPTTRDNFGGGSATLVVWANTWLVTCLSFFVFFFLFLLSSARTQVTFLGRSRWSTSIIFYILHNDVTSSSAINLHLHLIQGLPITGVRTALCAAANNEDNDPGRDQTNPPRRRTRLSDYLSPRYHAVTPVLAAADAAPPARQRRRRRSLSQLRLTLQIILCGRRPPTKLCPGPAVIIEPVAVAVAATRQFRWWSVASTGLSWLLISYLCMVCTGALSLSSLAAILNGWWLSLCELSNSHELNYDKNKPRRLDTEVA